VAGATVPIAYRFRLAQVPSGVNPYDAVADDALLWYEDETLVPFLFYGPTFPPLKEDETYAVQIIAYDEDGAVVIRNEGRSDVVTFRYQLATLQAPAWVAPTERFINTTEDGNVSFGWTRIDNGLVAVDYELFVYHIPENGTLADAQADPENYLIVNESDNGTGYLWETGKMDDFVELGEYAAIVRATSEDANVADGGYSEWLYFEVVDDGGTGNSSPLEIVQKDCGARFLTRGPQVRNNKDLAVGQRIRMQDLLLDVNSVRPANGGAYNGVATTLPTEQLPAIELQFNNLTVNKFGEVIAGQFEGQHREGSALPRGWRNARTPLTNDGLNRSFMQEQGRIFSEQRPDQRLPLRLDNGLLLTALTISPQSTKAKVVHLDYFTQGTSGAADWLIFGAGNADFTNAGLVYRNGEGTLPLIEEVSFQQSQAYQFRLYPGEDATKLFYDCEGTTGYQLVGEAKSSSRNSLRNEQGQPIVIGGFLNDRVSSPNDFMVRLTKRSPNGTTATFSTEPFVHISMPGHPLAPDSLILDHSFTANPVGMEFPRGSSQIFGGGLRWRGLAMPTLSMTLPPALTDEATGERIVRRVENFVIDSEGMSGATARRVRDVNTAPLSSGIDLGLNLNPSLDLNIIDLGLNQSADEEVEIPTDADLNDRTFLLAGWETQLDGYFLALEGDAFVEGNIRGRLLPKLLEEGLRFTGALAPSSRGMDISAELATNGRRVTLPLWKAKALLNENSELAIRLSGQGHHQSADINLRLNGTLTLEGDYGAVGEVSIPKLQFQDLELSNQSEADGEGFSFGHLAVAPGENLVGGYPIQPGEVSVVHGERGRKHLLIDYDFELGGTDEGIAASTTLTLTGEGRLLDGYRYENSGLDAVTLPPGHAGGADVMDYDGGTVNWEDDGNGAYGFRGEFGGSMGLLGDGGFTVIAQFGKTNRGRNYWGMQANVDLPSFGTIPSGIPGFDIGGFGGGIYYNMRKSDLPPTYQGTRLPLQDYRYVPRSDGQESYGLDLNVLMHTIGSKKLLNGRFGLGFDFLAGNLSNITLSAQAHFMEENTFSARFWDRATEASPDAAIAVNGQIVWDLEAGALYGNLGYKIGIGPLDMIHGEHDSAIDFSFGGNENWHFKIGEYGDAVHLKFTPRMHLFGKTYDLWETKMEAYFVTGNAIPGNELGPAVAWGLGNKTGFNHEFRIPGTGNDRIRFGGYLGWYANGFLGYGNSNCGAGDHFFTAAKAGFKGGLQLAWYDDCDKYELGSCDDWTSIGFDFDISLFAYFYDPSGLGIELDLPGFDPIRPTLGTYCDFDAD
ncbi:MAG: hypothetical protein AB8H12_11390, partial [Lewinella sp.]